MGGSLWFYPHYTKVTLNWTSSFVLGVTIPHVLSYLNKRVLEFGIADLVQTTPVTRLSYIYIYRVTMVFSHQTSLDISWYGMRYTIVTIRFSWIFMYFHGFSCVFMYFHGFSWIFMYFHGFSWILMYFHGFSCIFMYFHVFSYGLWSSKQTFHRAPRCHRWTTAAVSASRHRCRAAEVTSTCAQQLSQLVAVGHAVSRLVTKSWKTGMLTGIY